METKHGLAKMILAGFLWVTICNVCCAEDTIHWMTINYPPAYFIKGPRQGEGFCDVAGNYLRQKLAMYHHKTKTDVSIPRILKYWEDTERTYCISGLGVTVGQYPHTLYSKSMCFVPPVGIIIRKAERHRFVGIKGASLEELLKDTELILLVAEKGQYGERINALIKQHQGRPNIYERTDIDQVAMLKMLYVKRADYNLVYAFAVPAALDKLQPEIRDALLFMPIVEAEAPKSVHAVCNDTPLGRKITEQINHVLITETYKKAVTERLVEFLPEYLRSEYYSLNIQQIGQ